MKTSVLIPLALLLCSILIMYDIEKAYAQVDIEVITPTGGNLSSTSDCSDISAGNNIVWIGCNNLIYAVGETTHAVIANVSATTGVDNQILASVSGTSVFHINHGVDVRKYTLQNLVLTLAGIYDPSGCTIDGFSMIYDELGFLWFTCGAEDKIIRMNPNTLTTTMFSQDLTDGVGLECDDPTYVSYSTSDDIGVIYCNTTNNFVTFEVTSPTAITLLDDETGLTTEGGVFVHERYNRFFVPSSTGVTYYSYSALGVITLTQSAIGNGLDSGDYCHIEPYLSSDVFLVCAEQGSGILEINAFLSDASGFSLELNNAQTFTNPTIMNIGFDIQDQIWYMHGNSNNQNYVTLSGLREQDVDPDPPSGGTPNIIGGIDCNLPENENKLLCRVTDPIGGAGNFVIGNGTSGLTGIGCSIGLVDCVNDPNPRTNGLGLLIFIASLFVIIASFYLTIGRDAFSIPIYIWIVILLALSAFFTITGLIDPIFLILTAVAIIALAASRLKSVILGGSTMGEGSSA